MMKDLDSETSRSCRWNLDLMYLKCLDLSICISFTMYRKAMLGSLQYFPSKQRSISSSIHQRHLNTQKLCSIKTSSQRNRTDYFSSL